MPKTRVHEHSNFLPREDDVWSAFHSYILSVAQSIRPEQFAKTPLDRGFRGSNAGHNQRPLGFGNGVSHVSYFPIHRSNVKVPIFLTFAFCSPIIS